MHWQRREQRENNGTILMTTQLVSALKWKLWTQICKEVLSTEIQTKTHRARDHSTGSDDLWYYFVSFVSLFQPIQNTYEWLAHTIHQKYRFVIFVLTVIRSNRASTQIDWNHENKNLFTHSKCSSLFSATPFLFTHRIVFITNIFPLCLRESVFGALHNSRTVSVSAMTVLSKHQGDWIQSTFECAMWAHRTAFHYTCKESKRKNDERQVFLWNRNFSSNAVANAVNIKYQCENYYRFIIARIYLLLSMVVSLHILVRTSSGLVMNFYWPNTSSATQFRRSEKNACSGGENLVRPSNMKNMLHLKTSWTLRWWAHENHFYLLFASGYVLLNGWCSDGRVIGFIFLTFG